MYTKQIAWSLAHKKKARQQQFLDIALGLGVGTGTNIVNI